MIEIKKYAALDKPTKDTLNQIIEREFGDIPFVREMEWAQPDWTILYYLDREIVSFYNIIERNVLIDNREMKIAGINNVITPIGFRGKGYSSELLTETENLIFADLECQLGLLLCAAEMIPYYERLNWYKVDCPVYFEQADGERLWGASTMLLAEDKRIFPKQIRLNGLPW